MVHNETRLRSGSTAHNGGRMPPLRTVGKFGVIPSILTSVLFRRYLPLIVSTGALFAALIASPGWVVAVVFVFWILTAVFCTADPDPGGSRTGRG